MSNSVRLAKWICVLLVVVGTTASAQTLNWMGYPWNISTTGIGGGLVKGSTANVTVDGSGYLHLKLVNNSGTWTGSELFTQDNLSFGTYQWVLQGTNFYNMDSPVVLGLFTYGPQNGIGVDGEDEIDTEFSNWDGIFGTTPVNADFTVYPTTGHRNKKGRSSWEDDFHVGAPSSTETTVRMTWTSTSITWTIMAGDIPIGTTSNVIKTDTYNGTTTSIPQVACPLGMNLWPYKSLPTNNWEIVIENFQFVAQ